MYCVDPENILNPNPPPSRRPREIQRERGGGCKGGNFRGGGGGGSRSFFKGVLSKIGELLKTNSCSVEQAISYFTLYRCCGRIEIPGGVGGLKQKCPPWGAGITFLGTTHSIFAFAVPRRLSSLMFCNKQNRDMCKCLRETRVRIKHVVRTCHVH